MKTEVFTICWNEEYLLPYFLKHYSFADRIIVLDNGSDDKSEEVVKHFSNTVWSHYETGNLQDNEIMRAVKNTCWKESKADWVFVVDVDEFVVGWERLKEFSGDIVFKCQGWQMVGTGEPLEEIKYGVREVDFDKCCCFSPRIEDIAYNHGCHLSYTLSPVISGVLKLYHYSMLSEDYVVKRYKRYVPRMCQKDIDNKWGGQYLLSEDEIRNIYKDHYNRRELL